MESYRAGDGLYIARGCGKFAEYDCEERAFGGVQTSTLCVPHRSAEAHVDPTASAPR